MKVTIDVSLSEAEQLRVWLADLMRHRYGVPLQELPNILAERIALEIQGAKHG